MVLSLKRFIFIVLIIGFLTSLWLNYQHFQQQQHVIEWKEYSYNQFVSGVITGGQLLGYQTSWYDTKKASLAIGEAAVTLNQWIIYCDRAKNETAPHIKEVANYLSYIALIMADPNQQFEGDDIAGEEYIKKISKLLSEELVQNGAISDITDDNEEKIFNEMYNLIPKSKVEGTESRIDFFHRP
jgi:hypothetical protein